MVDALVTRRVLKWARKRAGVSVEAVAKRLRVTAQRIEDWEEERGLPSFARARELAQFMNVPFGYFFLDDLPGEKITTPDLRSIGDSGPEPLGADFMAVNYDAKGKQDWYREHLIQGGVRQLPFLGKFDLESDTANVAADMRKVLQITRGFRRQVSNWDALLRGLVAKAEAAGVLVLRGGIVASSTRRPQSRHQFRGFALSDPIAPLIFINNRGYKASQIFTLAHELAHIWLNASAISDYCVSIGPEGYDALEVFCRKVAAEFLVSRAEFMHAWNDHNNIDDNAQALSAEFRVSKIVIARRALDLRKISRPAYRAFARSLEGNGGDGFDGAKTRGGSGVSASSKVRISGTFVRAVLVEALEGRLLLRDAGRLLSIKPAMLRELAKNY